jgi:hypothetical protein
MAEDPDAGVRVSAAGASALPVSVAVDAAPGVALTVRDPDLDPVLVADGRKTTETVQLALAARVIMHVVAETAKSPPFVPPITDARTVPVPAARSPPLVTVKV